MENRKTVVVGVTGGIAAYKALDVISRLKKANLDVNVIMTEHSTKFVSPLSFQSLSQNMVITDMFAEPKAWEIQHISLAKKADLMLIVPATANIIGKVANGIADDMLSTTIMATKAPVVFAPAANTNMFMNPIVQNNIKKLREYGYKFIDPDEGRLACGDTGAGKLADTKLISDIVISMLYDIKDLKGKKVLVTAGPTIAPIDPVRYLTNRSTGKMGYAIAEEARDRGGDVTLVSGPCNLEKPFGINVINVNTNEEMLKVVEEKFQTSDIVIKAAAVADYKPKNYSREKIKKGNDDLILELTRDNDILKKLGSMKKNQILVGFAAESNNVIDNATAKLHNKNLDFIIANDITCSDTGFASEDNKVTILSKTGESISLPKMGKRMVAKELFNLINKKR
ncbi:MULTISPECIES: bifunctional phosphopantothenoylcysteine decarboxylase/phosphopantothenate--cysteine ligase CoaBC [Clostridium]|jgi:phosphopantothenoylcysteine decarboxylase / phosphopantothenate---cysteine ligase|uniref:Coenzyme A biosynthesis bifunctional protein CoaBC n=2 Tax=Clostridium TaxID=1485 RepID=A0A151AQT1_9CLOT|nr:MULTISPECIES: bifunctional phosphopantothenoylcysteine decarboxylase/phosphopantothenate--cysteine ligase CoaBC [Clostridium]KYH29942.1 coenzyme A biosynthesis bifunctional protein CoaBC [Clostridium colicanis DSM 13634]MBE6044145.1 bifunctional phosphopantothenoylcysteine decarboxylase/phosphopantothenate--cysteine ligase CoaBC [Clostridium thermopalmarium]PRR75960.1 Coenzyme A biosynthesis bifunctional protein CoaBC [Clostridium thermopalmarium DSM 5974]PVZ24537.1 phosphopantothenoylcystei